MFVVLLIVFLLVSLPLVNLRLQVKPDDTILRAREHPLDI